MPSLLVTVGTDGSKDWVRTPDGQRFALGPVSVLALVTRLSRNTKLARRVLDEFLKKGEAMLAVDDQQLWALLAPRRARWAAGPFMTPGQGGARMDPKVATESRTVKTLNTIAHSAAGLCDSLQASLNRLTAEAKRAGDDVQGPSTRDVEVFLKSLIAFRLDVLGWGSMTFSDRAAAVQKGLSVDTYRANMTTARAILEKAQETVGTIDKLVSEGKRFNASRARADVAQVTTKVASICSDTELTESWVQGDLAKLAARTDRIHRLFHPVAVNKPPKPPKAKFKVGDRVQVMHDGEELHTGKITRVVEYDSYAETWKYRVEIDGREDRGRIQTYNETGLKKR